MNRGTVCVAYLHPGEYKACFAESLTDLLFFDVFGVDDKGGKRRIIPNGQKIAKQASSGGIATGRCSLVASFLDATECEWLWMIDSDMGFEANTVERLIGYADPNTIPVVGGLCFCLQQDGRGPSYALRYKVAPTLYSFVDNENDVGFLPIIDYERNRLVEVSATGAACLLIHRSAVEKMREKYGDTWFQPLSHPRRPSPFSEDLSFCVRLASVGLPLYVHTGVQTTHDKGGLFLDEAIFDYFSAQDERQPVECG